MSDKYLGYIKGNSILHLLDGRTKLLSLFMILFAIVISSGFIDYLVLSLFILILMKLSKIGILNILWPIKRLWVFFLVVLLVNTFFFTTLDSIWSWWIFSLSLEGFIQGANIVFKVILIMILSNMLTLTTSPMEITSSIEWIIMPLKLIKIPVEDIAMILSISLQFIPTLIDETEMIKKAQIARGARFESKRIIDRIMALFPMIIPIFISAFRRADELSLAMEARGYRGGKNRTRRQYSRFRKIDYSVFIIAIVIVAINIAL